MLQELSIRNFALIDEARLAFPSGLILVTGETGAGKSIVIDALGLALGERASGQDTIRFGADRCQVEALFDLRDAPAATLAYLAEQSLLDEDDGSAFTLIVSRELSRAGKNLCRINGRLVTVATLREATDGLVDVHGQHEHQSLLASERHIDLLDSWLGADALALREQVGILHAQAVSLRRDLAALHESAKERARNLDLYRFQQDEITAAALNPGEEEGLATERTRLANAEKLNLLAQEAYAALDGGALDGLNSALSSAQRGAALDETLEEPVARLTDALAAADEARRSLRNYSDNIEFNQDRLEEIGERIELIRSLKRKYGETIEEIVAYGQELTAKLDDIENNDERESALARSLENAQAALEAAADQLSLTRRRGAEPFGSAIVAELRDLGMPQSLFDARIEQQETVGRSGRDGVEFLISPNPGEPLKPLAKIASGGELSRIMLALKTVLARTAYVPTLIFDEIDVGVGGRTALTIAQKLAALSRSAQVFCITHLPQIASRPAAAHLAIEKEVAKGRTTVRIAPLDEEGRVEEIARMLGGATSTPTVLQHARDMLDAAAHRK